MRVLPLAGAALLLAGCGPAQVPSSFLSGPPTTASATTTKAASKRAVTALKRLPVKGRAPKTGYDREALFPTWLDTDGDGCRADDQAVKQVANVELRDACREVAASMVDPYTGRPLSWGSSRRGVIDIDHVVSLSDAWQKGAQGWDAGKRARFANDQLNLVPVAAAVNRGKGDGDAATWLPPRVAYRCEYVARQVELKRVYGLWVTQAEKHAMLRVLSSCPRQLLPGPQRPAPATPTPSTTSTTVPALTTCAAVKAAGLGPYRRGVDPEYERFRDGDGDGIVCE